ncbi:MAG: NAD(P)/FAD-dependent oxidoreductase [Desulfovibrio sp.]|nr:NAD(P)/FAD-dependent oxidoreductase [Desulfovibrio sp.]
MSGHFDILILGGGPAGTRAALDAAGYGAKCALAEPAFLGGTCMNTGCIPTKFLLGGSASIDLASAQQRYKVAGSLPVLDFAALQSRKNRFIKGLRVSLQKDLEDAGVTLLKGKGRFTGPQSARIGTGEDGEVTFGKCIAATGSTPAFFPTMKADGAKILSSAGVLGLEKVPASMIIVGGGPIGLELGEIFHRFGCRVTLVEGMPRLLPAEDEEVSATVEAHFRSEGWVIHTGRRIASLTARNDRAVLLFDDGEEAEAERALIAAGRRPASADLSVETAGIKLGERGFAVCDDSLRCSEHIYAAGDLNGRAMLSHAATHQARYAAAHATGKIRDPYASPPVPACVYGSLEVMRVGPTLAELKKKGDDIGVSRVPLASNPIAQSLGHTRGCVRMLWEGDELRGISAVGGGVSHLVTAAALLLERGVKKNLPLPVLFAHPTLDEILESAITAPKENVA